MERELILQTLAATNNNKTRAAELLGISLKTLHNKLKDTRRKRRRGVGTRDAAAAAYKTYISDDGAGFPRRRGPIRRVFRTVDRPGDSRDVQSSK